MDLVDRYFAAIRRNLPAAKADDVVAELRDDFCSRQEAREAQLGRSLTPDETSALITEFGHPLVVASRFRAHQYLIGPDVYPFYFSVIRVVLMAIAMVIAVVFGASVVVSSQPVLQALAQAVGNLASGALISAAVVTLVFALLERSWFPAEHLKAWKPNQLPDIGEEQPGPWGSAAEVALTIAVLLWWLGAFRLPIVTNGGGFRLEPAPIWAQLYLPILLLIIARLVHNVVQWLRPRWRLVRAILGAATAIGALILLAVIYRSGEWATVVSTGMAEADRASLQQSLNLALKIALVAVGVIWTFNCLGELWRLARRTRERLPA